MSSGNWWQFCIGLNVLMANIYKILSNLVIITVPADGFVLFCVINSRVASDLSYRDAQVSFTFMAVVKAA